MGDRNNQLTSKYETNEMADTVSDGPEGGFDNLELEAESAFTPTSYVNHKQLRSKNPITKMP